MNRYHSPLRDQQRAATRERILEAACRDMAPALLGELGFADVARRAGVSERTVFRHFPTMRALQEAIVAKLEAEAGWPADGSLTAHDIPGAIRRAYLVFGRHSTPPREEPPPARESRRRRREMIVGALAPLVDGLPPARQAGAAAILHTLLSIETCRRLTGQWGLSPRAAGEAAAWAAEVLLGELARDPRQRRSRR